MNGRLVEEGGMERECFVSRLFGWLAVRWVGVWVWFRCVGALLMFIGGWEGRRQVQQVFFDFAWRFDDSKDKSVYASC